MVTRLFPNSDVQNAYLEWCRLTGVSVEARPFPLGSDNEHEWLETAKLLVDARILTVEAATRAPVDPLYNQEVAGALVTYLLAGALLYARGVPDDLEDDAPKYEPAQAMAVLISTRGHAWHARVDTDPDDIAIQIDEVVEGPFSTANEMYEDIWVQNQQSHELFTNPFELAYQRSSAKFIRGLGELHWTRFLEGFFRALTLNLEYDEQIVSLPNNHGYIIVSPESGAITSKAKR